MAARRLLIVMLVLLGVSTLAAALVPSRPSGGDTTGTTETTETTLPEDTLPSGKLFTATVPIEKGKDSKVPIRVGEQLLLLVSAPPDSGIYDQVEIPRLGLVDAVDPFSPARFDILARDPGSYPIRLVAAGRTVGRIVVSE